VDLEHSFTVPVGLDTAWAEFQDIASIAECFPGATVSSVDGDTFTGSVKVKLGPISLLYNGSGTFTEKDQANHRFVVEAKGKDRRGNGTAGATVTLSMDGGADSTEVRVHTDLAITGRPAQFGRGVMQDVSDKLLGQFAACLEQRLGDGPESGTPTADQAVSGGTAPDVSGPPPTAGSRPPESGLTTAGDDEAEAGREALESAAVPTTPVAPSTPPPAATPRPAGPATAKGQGDALDLGRTVLPALARTYWRPAAAVLVVVVIVIWLLTR
jgi:carbon monoxide dehydrogenase subunit G